MKRTSNSLNQADATYDEIQNGATFCLAKKETIPQSVFPTLLRDTKDWAPNAPQQLIELADRIRKVALPSLVDFFDFEHQIGGIRATDLFSLNSLMGATIEDQVVSTLNRHRETWDNGDWSGYTFRRSAQAFPDVRLTHRSNPDDIKIGIELKSWFLLSKEGVPSMRFSPHPDACAPLDMVCVIPWHLSNVVCGVPKIAEPWIQQAKFAAEWSMFFWTYLRKTDNPQTLSQRSFKEIGPCSPYPKKSDSISLHPKNDSGSNYGRLPRYHPIMDDFCEQALQTEILGIPAEDWRYFLQIHTETVTIDEVRKKLSSKYEIDSSASNSQILDVLLKIIDELPENLVR